MERHHAFEIAYPLVHCVVVEHLLLLQLLLAQHQRLYLLPVLLQELALQPVDRAVDQEAMVFEAGLGGTAVVALMMVEIVLLVLAIARAEASIDVEARVLLLLIHQGAAGAHLLEPAHSSLEAADVQRLHALVDCYSVEDTQLVAFSAPS